MNIHISAFINSKKKHGGYKRSEQICEEAEKRNRIIIGQESIGSMIHYYTKRPLILIKSVYQILLYGCYKFSYYGIIVSILQNCKLIELSISNPIKEYNLELAPGKSIIMGYLMMKKKLNYTLYPHNIEFLVPHQQQKEFRSHEQSYSVERSIILNSQKMWCISEFDVSVARAMGHINVFLYSYRPIFTTLEKLNELKKERIKSTKKHIIILGTVSNKPTELGIIQLIERIRLTEKTNNYTLIGYGTERFKNVAPKNVIVKGQVSDNDLYELLAKAKCVVINQIQTSGMLTKIIELNIAQIPTIVFGDYVQIKMGSYNYIRMIKKIERFDNIIKEYC